MEQQAEAEALLAQTAPSAQAATLRALVANREDQGQDLPHPEEAPPQKRPIRTAEAQPTVNLLKPTEILNRMASRNSVSRKSHLRLSLPNQESQLPPNPSE